MRPSLSRLAPAGALLVAALALGGCASLPPLDGRTSSTALTETADTRLGKAVSAADRDREDESGIYAAPAGKGRLCRPGRARARRGALARRAVLHLAYRHHRVPPARGALECRRARRARADAARRQRHQGAGPGPRRFRCAPQHRGSPLQPVPEPRLQTARLHHPFQAAEPPDAQQVLHRGHAAHDRGGSQRRRRVLRRRRGDALRGPRRGGGGADRGRSRRRHSTSIGTATPRIRPTGSWASRRRMASRT